MEEIRLSNGKDLELTCISKGCEITSLKFKGINIGTKGQVKGRVANRISGAAFTLRGITYTLDANRGTCQLHGGSAGFSTKEWEVAELNEASVTFALTSPDGDMGYPGTLKTTVTYTLTPENELRISYFGISDKDTLYNPVNHIFFNLNGNESVKDHALQINAAYITENDEEVLPTGKILPVEGTAYDFSKSIPFEGKYDNNFVLNGAGFRKAAELKGLLTGFTLETYTDTPGMQLFNTDKEICLETQGFPDAIHFSHFPQVILRAGVEFRSETVYRLS